MQFTAVFSPCDPTYAVTVRNLTIVADDGTTTVLPVGDGTITAFGFDADPNPGHTAKATLIDTNSAGDSAASNAVEFSLTPPTPPVPGVPPTPTIISITPGTTFGAGSFRKR